MSVRGLYRRPSRLFYIDSATGNNSNSGRSAANAWADYTNLQYVPSSSLVYVADGSVIYQQLQITTPGLRIYRSYTGPAAPITNGSKNIVGYSFDEVSPNVWHTTFIPINNLRAIFLAYDNDAPTLKQTTLAAVDGPGKWYDDLLGNLYVYSAGAPGTVYSSITVDYWDCIRVQAADVELVGLEATWGTQGVYFDGAENFYGQDLYAHLNSQNGVWVGDQSNNGYLKTITASNNGLGPDQNCEGLRVGFSTFTVTGLVVDGLTCSGNGEDNIQIESFGSGTVADIRNVTLSDGYENCLDVKRGTVIVDGGTMLQSGIIASSSPITCHSHAPTVTLRNLTITDQGSGLGINLDDGATVALDTTDVTVADGSGILAQQGAASLSLVASTVRKSSATGVYAIRVRGGEVTFSNGCESGPTGDGINVIPLRVDGPATGSSDGSLWDAPTTDTATYCLQTSSSAVFASANDTFRKGETTAVARVNSTNTSSAQITAGFTQAGTTVSGATFEAA